MNEPTANIDKFLGIRNKQQPRRLEVGSLTVAENVDIDDFGGIVLREGFSKSLPMNNITASFSTQGERRAFVVDNGELVLVNTDLTKVVLSTGFTSDYVYWLEVGDFILMSTGHIINKDNQVSLWRIPNPISPDISVVSGDLLAGQYQVTCTYVDELGREGGASNISVIDVNEGSGLALAPIYGGYKVRCYVSDVNGTELYLYDENRTGGFTITNTGNLTYPIDEVQLKAYPAPDNTKHLAFYDSRIWTSEFIEGASFIWYSEPFWWNLFNLQESYIQIPGVINALVGTPSGLIIATDDEIYAYTNESLVKLADYGVPKGKPYDIDDQGKVLIWTNQGLCEALPFQNLTESKVSLPPGDVCHTSIINQNGFGKVVVLTDGNGIADNKI